MKRTFALAAIVGALAAIVALVAVQMAGATRSSHGEPGPTAASCQLGHGVKHVINLVFDNVHFFRDNPNVPSDLEQMPHLLNFLKSERHACSRTCTRR